MSEIFEEDLIKIFEDVLRFFEVVLKVFICFRMCFVEKVLL